MSVISVSYCLAKVKVTLIFSIFSSSPKEKVKYDE